MVDKQIIIDGVNVAWCVRLQDDEISCDLGGECKGWENCYYKQLKRQEQKNEELKQTLAEIKFWIRELLKRTGQVVPYEIKQILQKAREVILNEN